ncbi:MAG: hypothetical protein ABIA74_05850 [bacterium]
MKRFKYLFGFLIISFFVFNDAGCIFGKKRKSTTGSSSSAGSNSGFCPSSVSSDEDVSRIFLVFKEGLLEKEVRNNFLTKINERCSDQRFQKSVFVFAKEEVVAIHFLFMKASKINLSEFKRDLNNDNVTQFNCIVEKLNIEFENFLKEKEIIYQNLYKLIENGIKDSLLRDYYYNAFLAYYKLLLTQNELMKEYIERRLERLEGYVDLISPEY